MELIITLFEWIGLISFALSGAMLAIQKEMDILGVCVLGAITATGGGIMRDLILGITPPANLANPFPVLLTVGVSIIIFLPFFQRILSGRLHKIYEKLMLIADSLGLGLFTVMGVNVVYKSMEKPTVFMCVLLGVITGVGGGVLRDILSNNKPYIFVKHFYACAAIIGALVCVLLRPVNESLAAVVGACVIFGLRLLAAKYRWKLPKHRYSAKDLSEEDAESQIEETKTLPR